MHLGTAWVIHKSITKEIVFYNLLFSFTCPDVCLFVRL